MVDSLLDSLQLMMGDIVISVETAARQAEERGHTLLDEIRILLVGPHLYFIHEINVFVVYFVSWFK